MLKQNLSLGRLLTIAVQILDRRCRNRGCYKNRPVLDRIRLLHGVDMGAEEEGGVEEYRVRKSDSVRRIKVPVPALEAVRHLL